MPFRFADKFVVGVASSALFDLRESHDVWVSDKTPGFETYRKYQRDHEEQVLAPGVAFPMVKRLANLNGALGSAAPVEIVLLSKNDPDTGLRVMRSIASHGLPITRAAFLGGENPFEYAKAFGAALFLSADEKDVSLALAHGVPAAQVIDTGYVDTDDTSLRVAFDFDGVIVDRSSEDIFQTLGLAGFHENERRHAAEEMPPGPLGWFVLGLAGIPQRPRDWQITDGAAAKVSLKVAIVTARNAPAHERVVTTLRAIGVTVDQAFFLGGADKGEVLGVLRPHIFFDDQLTHLQDAGASAPCAHVPPTIVVQDSAPDARFKDIDAKLSEKARPARARLETSLLSISESDKERSAG